MNNNDDKTKWKIWMGDVTIDVSPDLANMLGFDRPYLNSDTARYDSIADSRARFPSELAEAYDAGLRDDSAARRALSLISVRRAEQRLQAAKQKVAEFTAQAAADHRAAEGMALARAKLQCNGSET